MAARLRRAWSRSEEGLSDDERAFASTWRVVNFLTMRGFVPMSNAQNQTVYLALCGGDAGLMGEHHGQTMTLMNLGVTFVSPYIAALSDRFGRMRIMVITRCAHLLWYGLVARVDTLRQRMILEVLTHAVTRAEPTVFEAAHTDMFGSRPELSARILTADMFWAALVGIVAPGGGAFLCTKLGNRAFGISMMFVLITQLMILRTPETLRPEKRKPVSLRRANPFSNLRLLFSHGPGLRRLAIMSSVYFSCMPAQAVAEMVFRIGVMGWSPAQCLYFNRCAPPTHPRDAFVVGGWHR